MVKQFLETGKIVNTHGVRGEIKIEPWADSPAFLTKFEYLYIDGEKKHVLSARVHKGCVIALLEGIDDINAAMCFKNKIVSIDRADAKLPKGSFFLQDLYGLEVYDENDKLIGTVFDVMTLPCGNVYDVRGEENHLIPDAPEFIRKVDIPAGRVTVRLIEGM